MLDRFWVFFWNHHCKCHFYLPRYRILGYSNLYLWQILQKHHQLWIKFQNLDFNYIRELRSTKNATITYLIYGDINSRSDTEPDRHSMIYCFCSSVMNMPLLSLDAITGCSRKSSHTTNSASDCLLMWWRSTWNCQKIHQRSFIVGLDPHDGITYIKELCTYYPLGRKAPL